MKKRDVSLNTEAHRDAFDSFADAMNAASSREGWRSSETLDRFVEAGFRAVRGALLKGSPSWRENEDEYMGLVKRCRHPGETMADLSRMLGALGTALLAEPVDFLGPMFGQLSAEPTWGQFFTPFHISYFMAKMIVGDAAAALKDKPYITLCEPACGVGGMTLAANVALREAGFDVARQAHWHMTDVDGRAARAAYLQVSLSDASALVVHGNSLSLENWWKMPTPAAVLFPKSFRAVSIPSAPKTSACASSSQLELLFPEPI